MDPFSIKMATVRAQNRLGEIHSFPLWLKLDIKSTFQPHCPDSSRPQPTRDQREITRDGGYCRFCGSGYRRETSPRTTEDNRYQSCFRRNEKLFQSKDSTFLIVQIDVMRCSGLGIAFKHSGPIPIRQLNSVPKPSERRSGPSCFSFFYIPCSVD